ncbi:substrate-binding periplasmic protein [Nitrincola sp. MINF-07-Sa-05]|uniref:substrate-binding periplasmic protein n=1 Tax=Nitrincola salilacus TaxID=3400273 RepID=UPI003917EC61
MHFFRQAIFHLIIWGFSSALQAAQPEELTFCHEDQDSFPWVMKDGTGLNLEMMRLLERELEIRIHLVALPWPRCMSFLQSNPNIDGAFASSFRPERLTVGRYPVTSEGELDSSLRLHISGYSLYRRKGTDVDWDGEQFIGLNGSIDTQSGFSIIDLLNQHGLSIDAGSNNPEAVLFKLATGRTQAAALQTFRGDNLLSSNPDIARYVEKTAIPLEEKPYYLMLSFGMLDTFPEFSQKIWKTMAEIRESEEFQLIEHDYLQQYAE